MTVVRTKFVVAYNNKYVNDHDVRTFLMQLGCNIQLDLLAQNFFKHTTVTVEYVLVTTATEKGSDPGRPGYRVGESNIINECDGDDEEHYFS